MKTLSVYTLKLKYSTGGTSILFNELFCCFNCYSRCFLVVVISVIATELHELHYQISFLTLYDPDVRTVCMRRSGSSPHSASLTSAWQTGSRPSQGGASTSCYRSPSSPLLYTSPKKERTEATLPCLPDQTPG